MNGEMTTTVKIISEDIIEVLGETYYKEDYLKIMMERSEQKGFRDGLQKPVIHHVCDCKTTNPQ